MQLVLLFSLSGAQNVRSSKSQEKPSFDHQLQHSFSVFYSFLVFVTILEPQFFPNKSFGLRFSIGTASRAWPGEALYLVCFGELPHLALDCNVTKGGSGLCKHVTKIKMNMANTEVHETKVRFFFAHI